MVGWHLYFQEDFRLAARAFEAAARDLVPRQPRGETVDLYLGRTLRRLPDPQSALDHARLALARVSGSDTVIEAALWSDIGGDLEDLGQHADALEALRRAAAPPRST